jgi:cyclopropane fatty-acyl-phospholipid synthase-like methyltransferase
MAPDNPNKARFNANAFSVMQIPLILKDLFQPWNTTANLTIWVIAVSLAINYSFWWILLYPFIIFGNEVLIGTMQINLFDASEAIEHGYSYSRWIDDDGSATGDGLDYGFNFYNGDYKKTRRQAQVDKYNFAFEKLGLKEGMRVFDCGCGCGDWLHWLQTEKKCTVQGLNITNAQVQVCRGRGLKVVWSDWKKVATDEELQKTLYGKFDAVTFWDTVEHYVPMHVGLRDFESMDKIYLDMYDLAVKCLDKKSEVRGVWISCLHTRMDQKSWLALLKSSVFDALHCMYYYWLLDRFHSGCYPNAERDQLVMNAEKKGFKLIGRKDETMDYFMTSEINPTHFGKHKFILDSRRFALIFFNVFMDPAWFPRLLWLRHEGWMYQFDKDNIDKSDMQLWWLWFKLPVN